MNYIDNVIFQCYHICHPKLQYERVVDIVGGHWKEIEHEFSLPYFPHVSIGWDNNARYNGRYTDVMEGPTPELFEKALIYAKHYLDTHPDQPKLITVNSWNEWTEGSYLQPDNLFGYGYLEALKNVFGSI